MTRSLILAALVALSASYSSDLNAYDANGNTALMVAAAHGDVQQVQNLIDQGAEIDARGRIGNTALIYAAQEGHTEIVETLIEAGADINVYNDYRATADNLAKGHGHRDIAKTLEAVILQATNATQDKSHI